MSLRQPLEQNSSEWNDPAKSSAGKSWLNWWWPAIVWAVVISLFSTGAFTSENTSRFIIPALRWLFPHASTGTLSLVHHYIRKTGHLTEYFVLSLLLLRGIRRDGKGMRVRWALAVIVIVLCYASLDEFHQSFVPGRTPAVSDVMLDTCGGILAQAVAALVTIANSPQRQRDTEKSESE